MYPESDFIHISALQHYLYCPRQCALIYLEQVWTENLYTAEGRLLHEKADSGKVETRGDVKTVSALLLRSALLGLTGKADMVEFHREAKLWRPYPVEYKRGRAKSLFADRVQLCAQALCLEEMTGLAVPEGALFYGKTRRRQAVLFDAGLRDETRNTVAKVHELLEGEETPPPAADERCAGCSLLEEWRVFT
jgi:CRISPR-associated exonuclease Cas4